jgi:hypothetical protein
MVNSGTDDGKQLLQRRNQCLPEAGDSVQNDNQDNCLLYIPIATAADKKACVLSKDINIISMSVNLLKVMYQMFAVRIIFVVCYICT